MASDIRQNGFSEDPPQVVATWLRWDGIPAEASMSEPQGLHSAQLPPAFEQRHRLIRQQLTTGDLQPPASTIPEGGPKVQHLPTIADPRLSGLKRRPVVVSTSNTTSDAQPRWRCRASDQPLLRLASEHRDAVHPGVVAELWQVMQTVGI